MQNHQPRAWAGIVVCALFFFVSFLNAQSREIPKEVPPPENSIQQAPKANTVFKFAWELPNYQEKYPFAKSYLWTEPSGLGEAYIISTLSRDRDKGDEESLLTYVAFRPFAIELKGLSLAIGLSYGTALSKFEAANTSSWETWSGDSYYIEVKDSRGYSTHQGVCMSILGTVPDWGMQFIVDVGYSWQQLKGEADLAATDPEFEFPSNVLLPTKLEYDDYRYKQRDEGIFISFELRKFFDRNYLNFIHLTVFANLKLETTKRKAYTKLVLSVLNPDDPNGDPFYKNDYGKVSLPTNIVYFPDTVFETEDVAEDVQGRDFNSSFVGANLMVRLFTCPVDLPILQDQGISLDAMVGVEHNAGELFGEDMYGVGISLGGQLSFFDIVSVGYTYTFQRNNPMPDEWGLAVMVALFGGISPNSRPTAPGGSM